MAAGAAFRRGFARGYVVLAWRLVRTSNDAHHGRLMSRPSPRRQPGWYPDPADANVQRWWSGRDWTEHRRGAPVAEATTPPGPAPILTSSVRPAAPKSSRLVLKTVLVGFAVFLLLFLGVASGGIGGLLLMAALIGLVVGMYTLIRGRSQTFWVRGRKGAAIVLGASVVTFLAGTTAYGAAHPVSTSFIANTTSAARSTTAKPAPTTVAPPAATSPAPLATPTPTRTVAPLVAPVAGSALAVLATLPVKGRAPMTGYARTADFGTAWLDVDRNGCDTRNDILRRDLVYTTSSGCRVLAGTLSDPYTRTRINFVRGATTSTAVQIDHVVALGDAWQTGAQQSTFPAV